MAKQSSGLPTHRAWIQQARSQSEQVARQAGESTLLSSSSEAAIVSPDSFPGYDLEREIHRGAQGVVYRATQKSTGRPVALKLLHDHAFGGTLERARFEREMRILAALKHPNIVTIHDGGAHEGRVFLVMDYIAGQPLDVYMASQPRSIPETLELLIQICDAVNAAHVQGIIHRDLKPANVRVDASGKPFVLDFGLAKLAAGALEGSADERGAMLATTMTGQFLGSLPWAAPEQAEGSPSRIDMRTDVYSLGILLYQMLTGQFPYSVIGAMKEVLETIVLRSPTSPRLLRHEIDDELETIVLKCLSKERDRRYQTAGEFAADLRRYLAGEAIDAKRDSQWYVLRKTLRQHRLTLTVAILFIALLAGSMAVALVLSARANRAAMEARRAESEASEARQLAVQSLHASLIQQARANRHSGLMGQRFDSLEALAKAAVINPTVEVRNEVIAASAMVDLQPTYSVQNVASGGSFDADFARCVLLDTDNGLTLIRVSDEVELAHIPPPAEPIRELHSGELRGPWLIRLYDPVVGQRRLEVWRVPEARLAFEVTDVPFRARYDISPDGSQLAVGRSDHAIHIYDLGTGTELQRLPLDRDPSYLAFDPSGRRLVLYHANYLEAQLLDLDSGKMEPVFESKNVEWSVAWRADGRLLAGASGSNIEIWDVLQHRRIAVLSEHEDHVVHVMFSHDGKFLLSAGWDGRTVLWEAQSKRTIVRWNMTEPTFSPDDQSIAGTFAGKPSIFKLERGTSCRRIDSNEDVEERVFASGAFIPGLDLLAALATDLEGNSTLQVYDLGKGGEVAHQKLSAARVLVADPLGRFFLTAQTNGLVRWPTQSENGHASVGLPATLSGSPCDTISLSADGNKAVFGDLSEGRFSVIDVRSRALLADIAPGQRAACVRISPDGRWVAIGMWWVTAGQNNDGSVEIWDVASGKRVTKLPLSGLSQVEFSPNGKVLATSDAQSLELWETGTWRRLRRSPNTGRVFQFSPDGRMLAVAPDETRIRLLDSKTLEEIATLEPPENFSTTGCIFSPSGTLLAQLTNRKGVVHLWDLTRIRSVLVPLGLDWKTPESPP